MFFRWEPAPILVCVEDPTEDLDYVSKNVRVRLGYRTRYISPPKLYQAKGVDAEVHGGMYS